MLEIKRPGKVAEYQRLPIMELLPGESHGYWKYHSPGKWFRQAKITGNIHNAKAIVLLDAGAEVSIVDTTFARKVECCINSSQIQDCVGTGDNAYRTEGRTRIKITLAGSLVYFFDIWVGDLTGQPAILGMDLMVSAAIRFDLAHGSISWPDEVRILRQLYSDKAKIVNVGQHLRIHAVELVELPLRLRSSTHNTLWGSMGADNIRRIRDNDVHIDHQHWGNARRGRLTELGLPVRANYMHIRGVKTKEHHCRNAADLNRHH
ncbi:hypothetical protein PHMEG_0007364 [Phytophthora megakarya]|uniref:Eukaryotic/viral aspartic protease n=1 Tax=Phytophthora megakarya TaxID=4795 RepID=A0A225WM48_9STRA|nr:hypothetical protein PHMEG_0007364 [Phytophthora megakarya]